MSATVLQFLGFMLQAPSTYASLAGELRRPALLAWAAGGYAAAGAAWAGGGNWLLAAICAALAVVCLFDWWRRRRRDRARKSLGAKARALRDALVRSMPRWSPRLQPQGARA